MSKYIDVEDLEKELSKAPVWTTLAVKEIIDEAPSIDIVRCAECTERDDDWCMYFGNVINPDDFCSYGEREGE